MGKGHGEAVEIGTDACELYNLLGDDNDEMTGCTSKLLKIDLEFQTAPRAHDHDSAIGAEYLCLKRF